MNSPEDRRKGGLATGARIKEPGKIEEKEFKVLEGRLVHGMTLHEAALHAGYEGKESTLKVRAHQIIKKHKDANSELIQAMTKVGIDADLLAQKIAEGLKSTTFVKRKVDRDSEELVEVADNHARHKFLETAVDVVGAKAPKKIEIEQKTFEQRLLEITLRREIE